MEKFRFKLLVLLLGSFLLSFNLLAKETATRKLLFDDNWYFHLGELENKNIETAKWEKIDLPHDWSIELPFSKNAVGESATGYKDGGTGWYLKHFALSNLDSDKKVILYFEGVYMESTVWLNGKQIGYHPYGYTSFRYDITDNCKSNGELNELLIKVENKGKNSRWYSGSGIYRHVWLIRTDKIHLDTWATFVNTDRIAADEAEINISTEIFNETSKTVDGFLSFTLFDNKGKKVSESNSAVSSFNKGKNIIQQKVVILKPAVWELESPTIYTLKIKALINNQTTDSISIPFGIRTIAFSAEKGFQLNGKTVKLKGGCMHHDNGLLGAATIDRAEIRKVELLKANEFNAVRCSHNPPSEMFLHACDSLGILVIDEAFDQWQKPKNPNDYHRFFDEWSLSDIESMVRRDRNHPSIIMWSIGNEIQERADSMGMLIASNLKKVVTVLDTIRPITAAVNEFWDNSQLKWTDSERAFQNLDVCGYNYMWREYENDHQKYPNRIIFGSESTAMERAENWYLVEAYPYIIGDFIWTAMDYLGEAGIGNTDYYTKDETKFPQFLHYPCFNAWCGDIDICGNAKPQSLYRDIVWNTSKIAMLVHSPIPEDKKEHVSYWGWPDELPSWNWKKAENKELEVNVYSRDSVIRLYLNDRFLEEKSISRDSVNNYTFSFHVPYQKGELKAVGLCNGLPLDSVSLKTTGEVTGIRLTADRKEIRASRNDLAYISIELIDAEGNIVPDEDRQLSIKIEGDGQVVAGNAAPQDIESFRSLTPKTFRGQALAIIRPTGNPGNITLSVQDNQNNNSKITIIVH